MLLVVARAPSDRAAQTRVGEIAGLALGDVARKLAGPPPRVLLVDATGAAFDSIGQRLEELGIVTFSCDPRIVPGDDSRLLVRRVEFQGDGLAVWDGAEVCHHCPFTAVGLIQRGVRIQVAAGSTTKTTERKFAVGRALLSGGLLVTKKTESTTPTKPSEDREPFILVQREDGEPDLILYERRIDYRRLGPLMAASSRANLEVVASRLRDLAPSAPYDDTVVRPGYVSGLPLTGADPVDLALHLVALARRALG